jgi:hypothetical protein
MDNATVKQIVANPYHDPEDIVKFYLSRPQYLEEWLTAKGKALAGVSIDCQQCVVASYLQEKLTGESFEFSALEVTMGRVEVFLSDNYLDIRTPEWVEDYVQALDRHRNPGYPLMSVKSRKAKIFSGNLAKNILKVVLAGLPQAVE